MIGQSDGRLVQLNGAHHKVIDTAQAVQQRILAVHVKVYKWLLFAHVFPL
jgi:hypothetical protein